MSCLSGVLELDSVCGGNALSLSLSLSLSLANVSSEVCLPARLPSVAVLSTAEGRSFPPKKKQQLDDGLYKEGFFFFPSFEKSISVVFGTAI